MMGEGERLSDLDTLKHLTKPFEEHVLRILNPDPPCELLRNMRRIATLLKMLEWPGQPYGRIRNQEVEDEAFKRRKVLPDPSDSSFGSFPINKIHRYPRTNQAQITRLVEHRMCPRRPQTISVSISSKKCHNGMIRPWQNGWARTTTISSASSKTKMNCGVNFFPS
jgi:hypothetical protein